jgi:hypothetical protein
MTKMSKSELRKIAITRLNNNDVQLIKKQLCNQFIDRKQKKDCMISFDKSFIKSFISTRQNQM